MNAPEWMLEAIEAARSKAQTTLDLNVWRGTGEPPPTIPDQVFELQHLEKLDLSGWGMEQLPRRVCELRNLNLLNLSGNRLRTLSESLRDLSNLRTFHLTGNPLEELPAWVTGFSSLEELSFGSDAMSEPPEWVGSISTLRSLGLLGFKHLSPPKWLAALPTLKHLNLSGNNLTEFPMLLLKLSNLETLRLDANNLTKIPSSIDQLVNLTLLSIWVNRLTGIPDSITELRKLKFLRLGGNRLSRLPSSLPQLQALEYLDLSNNRFSRVQREIYELRALKTLALGNHSGWGWMFDLRSGTFSNNNSIKRLSSKVLQLTQLEVLELEPNDMEVPPPEVAAQGAESILAYFRQVQTEGTDQLYEAKLLVIGEGGAGKTTFARKVKNFNYKLQDEESTRGIDVIRWSFLLDNGRDFQVNIWDFGGQEIYHATHQFFLTKRSLYVLVVDARKEDTDFYYWLNVVELLSGNSPLLIVKNEKQERQREISERQLRGQFSNLKETFSTNLATNRGLDEILSALRHYLLSLPHIGAPLPKTWVRVRQQLEQDIRNYIGISEFFGICQLNGVDKMKDKLQLIGYLHDLGVCLHFHEDPVLKNIVILKPSWGTDAVYRVLDNQQVIHSLGYFSKNDLAKIWHDEQYKDMQDELLRLMINFKLCYEIPGNEGVFIAPQLLTENQPAYHWNANQNLVVKYAYEFMPKGIVSQLIVRMNRFIVNQDLVWKTGVVLEKGDSRAEVVEFYGKREIRIRVTGKRRKEFMTVLTYELDNLHASFRRLRFSKLVPCNCSQCLSDSQGPSFYPLEVLNKFVQDEQVSIQCQKSYQMVNVLGLIDEVVNRAYGSNEGEAGRVVFNAPVATVVLQSSERGVNIMGDAQGRGAGSAWANGLFYLFVFVVVIATLGVLAGAVPGYLMAAIVISGVLFIPLIGVLQLRQDDRLSEKSFVALLKVVIGQLPIIKQVTTQSSSQD